MLACAQLFNQLDDLVIDLPNARSMVSEFLESAVKLSLVDAKEADALQASAKYLADRAAVQKDKDKIKFIVAEYFQTQDTDNALKVPSLTWLATIYIVLVCYAVAG